MTTITYRCNGVVFEIRQINTDLPDSFRLIRNNEILDRGLTFREAQERAVAIVLAES